MKTQQEIDAIAARVREGGIPDFLNRWLGMTPETLAANEAARKRQSLNMERRTAMPTIGPKEQALKDLRNRREQPFKEEPDMPRTAKPAKPAKTAAAPAGPKTKKTDAAKEAKTAAAQRAKAAQIKDEKKPKKKGAAARARTPVDPNVPTKAIRPGSKMAIISGLLARAQGCTADDVKKACEWPSVSMPQQAKSLGIELHKRKDADGVMHYADHSLD